MKIGMTLTPHMNATDSVGDAIADMLWCARYADENDFDVVWTTEHHFKAGSFSGSPSVILTQFAAITQRIQLGYAVAVVPLHHPLRLAEEMAWVDQFSNGQLIGGASQGWAAYEFDVLGVDIAERSERYEEGLTLLRRALQGGVFSHEGRFWNVRDVEVFPPTVQRGGPKFVVATTSQSGVETAAQLRVSPVMGFEDRDALVRLRDHYIATATAEGVGAVELDDLLSRVGALRRIIVRDTDEEAEAETIDASAGFSRVAQSLLVTQKGAPVEGILRRRPDEQVDDPRKSYSYGGTIWGSPDTVVEKLLALRDIGLGQVILQFHTNTRDRPGSRENMRRFAQDVLPAYRAREKALVTA